MSKTRPIPLEGNQRCPRCGASVLICDSNGQRACSNPDCCYAAGLPTTEPLAIADAQKGNT